MAVIITNHGSNSVHEAAQTLQKEAEASFCSSQCKAVLPVQTPEFGSRLQETKDRIIDTCHLSAILNLHSGLSRGPASNGREYFVSE